MTQMRETHDPKCVRCIFENAARTCNSRLKVQKGEVCAFKPHSSDQFFSLVVEKRMTKKNSNTRRANTQEAMAGASSTAAPPSFTREWVLNNPEAFRKLSTPPAECPICMEPFGPGKAPLGAIMGDTPTSCRHFLCKTCWLGMIMRSPTSPFHCPICREDVTEWLGGVMHEFLDKTTERNNPDKRFMQYMGKSIVMALRFGDVEMAHFGTIFFANIWGLDALEEMEPLVGPNPRPAAPSS